MQRIRLLLPAYNEALSLPSLFNRVEEVKKLSKLDLEVCLVNDGSTDDTLEIAKAHHLKVIDLQPNRGLAGALREGMLNSIKELSDDDILVTMDADDSHHPNLIPQMINQIVEGSDIVIASRYQAGSKVVGLSKFRVFLTQGAGILYRLFASVQGVKDYTCGYRAYKIRFVKQMVEEYKDRFIEQEGFACMGEILLKSRRFNPKITEVPLVLRYDRKQGESKMNIFNSIRQTLFIIFTTKK